jgi:hypothetical protein
MKKSLSKKSSSKALDRPDVITKTIFRILRSFYNWKFDDFKGRGRKKGKNRPNPDIFMLLDGMT